MGGFPKTEIKGGEKTYGTAQWIVGGNLLKPVIATEFFKRG